MQSYCGSGLKATIPCVLIPQAYDYAPKISYFLMSVFFNNRDFQFEFLRAAVSTDFLHFS